MTDLDEPGGDEEVAELMAQHGAARYADVETIAACLGRPRPSSSSEPVGPDLERRAPSLE
jgi:hypothetical protein